MSYKILFLFLLVSLVKTQELSKEMEKDPKKAFYFSLIPGMGQVYNGKIIKSAFVIGLETAAYLSWRENRNRYSTYEQNDFPLSKNSYLKKRNKYAWWIGIIYAYSMIDAIVDAHLHPFGQLMKSPITREEKEEDIYAN